MNTYKLQLQQVEAALTTDPTNEELVQLKLDLEQVIALTSELINGGQENTEDDDLETAFQEKEARKAKKSKSRWGDAEPVLPVKPWQVGENCQAIYTVDGEYREAVIEDINSDQVTVKFLGYKGSFTSTLSKLKMPRSGNTTVHAVKTSKRELEIKRKEYLKEKKRKKQEKMKDLVESKEKEKGKWLNFSHKAFGKRGFVKKSIFKTPESSDGKVGVGTCGVSGQGMTDFNQATKYRKTL